MSFHSLEPEAPNLKVPTGHPETRGAATHPILRIAYQGEPGAYGEVAILAQWGDRAVPVPCARFEDVGRLLCERGADSALLPVENSTIGAIRDAIDVIERYGLHVTGEHVLHVRHCLLGVAGARMESLRIVRSHQAALAQCARFLRAHTWLRAESVLDTAGAAREVARERDPAIAAIASSGAAARHGLDILAADIQDEPDNRTRFAIVEPGPLARSRRTASSLP